MKLAQEVIMLCKKEEKHLNEFAINIAGRKFVQTDKDELMVKDGLKKILILQPNEVKSLKIFLGRWK